MIHTATALLVLSGSVAWAGTAPVEQAVTWPGAGDRPWSDCAAGDACTNGHCDRRGQYFQAATDLLVSDLDGIAARGAAIRQIGFAGSDSLDNPDTVFQ